MKKGLFCKLTVLISIIFCCGSANSEIMAYWNFGSGASTYTETVTTDNVSGSPALYVLGGDKDLDGKDGLTGQGAAWDDVSRASPTLDAYFAVEVNATGWQNIQVSFGYMSDNSGANLGPTSVDFQYSTGPVGYWQRLDSWNNIALIRDDNWHTFTMNLSAIAVVNDQAILEFLLDDFDQDDLDGAFTFDNLVISGTPIPEPATMLLFGLGGVLLRRSKR